MPILLEIRSYQLKQGCETQFDRIMMTQSIPLLRTFGTDVVAARPSLHERGCYVLMRAYRDLSHRQQSQDAFYGSDAWKSGPRAAVLDCIEFYTTVVIEVDEKALSIWRQQAVLA